MQVSFYNERALQVIKKEKYIIHFREEKALFFKVIKQKHFYAGFTCKINKPQTQQHEKLD